MNFLGHAYIARNNPELIAGNFAGDSYKGNLANFDLPKDILDGIKLHRFIDNYTDHSDIIIEAGHIFQNAGISKVTYIAIDIILDHYLTKNWSDFSPLAYEDFVEIIYAQTNKHLTLLDLEFQQLYFNLKKYEWFFDYQSEQGIRKVLNQFSRRIGFKNNLDRCMEIYLNERETFDSLFKTFLVEINTSSVEFIKKF